MTLISSREFATNQKKYFDLAVSEQIYVKRGKNMFVVTCAEQDDIAELALAKERKNSGGTFTSTSDFIAYLRK